MDAYPYRPHPFDNLCYFTFIQLHNYEKTCFHQTIFVENKSQQSKVMPNIPCTNVMPSYCGYIFCLITLIYAYIAHMRRCCDMLVIFIIIAFFHVIRIMRVCRGIVVVWLDVNLFALDNSFNCFACQYFVERVYLIRLIYCDWNVYAV